MALSGPQSGMSTVTDNTINPNHHSTTAGPPPCGNVSGALYEAQTLSHQFEVWFEERNGELERQAEELRSEVKKLRDTADKVEECTQDDAMAQSALKVENGKALGLENITRIHKNEVKHLNKKVDTLKGRVKDLERERAPLIKYCKAVIKDCDERMVFEEQADGRVDDEEGIGRTIGKWLSGAREKMCC